jgi:PKD repeat protein
VLIITLISNFSYSQTYVSGTITGIWTLENSPYIVTGDVLVGEYPGLTIEPGVTVKFDAGCKLTCSYDNVFKATGTADSMIVFTSNAESPVPGSWNTLEIKGTYSAQIAFCKIEYATQAITLKALLRGSCEDYDTKIKIEHCLLQNNQQYGIYGTASGLTGTCIPAWFSVLNPTIKSNEIAFNGAGGIYLSATGSSGDFGIVEALISGNSIHHNRGNAIHCTGTTEFEAVIYNNTIVANASAVSFENNVGAAKFKLLNNNIFNNTVGIQNLGDSLVMVENNNVWNNTTNYIGITPSGSNLAVNPLCVDTTNYDYHLQQGSALIDHGQLIDEYDPDASIPDVGAFPFLQNLPPKAQFTSDKTTGTEPLNIQFTDKSVGNISSYSWNFGDGTTSSLQNPSHTYVLSGSYSVSLTATGPYGSHTENKSNYITVNPGKPVAQFLPDYASGDKPMTVYFINKSTGTITDYLWEFGDGKTSTEQNPIHVYDSAGYFMVSLTVTGPGGSDNETKFGCIAVMEPKPVANFTASPVQGTVPLTVEFAHTSIGKVTGFTWNFGDGSMSTLPNVTHTYNATGSFTVSLYVNGPGGTDEEIKTGYIQVDPIPTRIEEITDTKEIFSILPNPATTHCIVSFNWDNTSDAKLGIYDNQGQLIREFPVKEFEDAHGNSVTLNLSDLKTGVYYVRASAKECVITRKLVIIGQ